MPILASQEAGGVIAGAAEGEHGAEDGGDEQVIGDFRLLIVDWLSSSERGFSANKGILRLALPFGRPRSE